MVFVATTNGLANLWIRSLDSPVARQLQDKNGASQPFWSPDSRAIGFFANGDLKRIDVAGGPASSLARATDPRGAAWNVDGTIVFSPLGSGPLQRVSASGGAMTALTQVAPGETSHRWPQFLPNGRSLLYYAIGDRPAVYLTTIDTPGETTRVIDAQSSVTYFAPTGNTSGYLLWTAADAVVAQPFDATSGQLSGSPVTVPGTEGVASFPGTGRTSISVSNDGSLLFSTGGSRFQLAWFAQDGAAIGRVGGIDQYLGLRLSPDSREALVTIRDTVVGDLWRVDLSQGARTRVTSGGAGWYAAWSPDGQQIAFTSRGGKVRDAMVTNARGSGEPRSLWTSEVAVYPSDWSAQGYLAYTESNTQTADDVGVFSMADGNRRTLVLKSAFTEVHAQFSPDGHWLAFTSNESGRDDVYVQSYPEPNIRRLVSSGGGAFPRWSPDGGELFYRASDGRLMRVPIRTSTSSVELGAPIGTIRLVEPPARHLYPYDIARDGRILTLAPPTTGTPDVELTLRTNWAPSLKP